MVTVTLGELVDAREALVAIVSIPLAPASAYRVAKLCRAVDPDLIDYQQQCNRLLAQYGCVRDSTDDERSQGLGATVSVIPPDKVALVEAGITELRREPVRLMIDPLTMDVFGDHAIAPKHLLALGPLLAEELPR